MQQGYCPTNCKVQFLSELNVCTLDGCVAPLLRCKNCFSKVHFSMEDGKKKTHPHKKFDESQYFRNFCYLIKAYEIILKRFIKTFGKLTSNHQYFAFQLFISSQFVSSCFESQYVKAQLFVLKELYYKRPPQNGMTPSSQIIPSISLITQKSFNNIRTLLTQPSEQQQFLTYFFNQISNNNSKALERFIIAQQDHFIKYCEQISQKNQNLDIFQYLKRRRQASDTDKVYFSRIFQTFMEQKYEQGPQQQIFTASQYTNFVWENLHTFSKNKEIQLYLDSWVANYYQYSKFMTDQQLQPTLLSFRMWKDHVPSTEVSTIQNKYFLDNLILSYISALINSQYGIMPFGVKDWRQYIQYLRDYVDLSKSKGQQFLDLSKYTSYYQFRQKSQDFINHIQNSSQVVYNRAYCIQYLNNIYKQGNKVAKKTYKAFLGKKQKQEKQKAQQLKLQSEKLSKQLSEQEGQKYYLLIFNDYLLNCIKENALPNKDKYRQFKKQVLERYDQQEIKLANDRLLLQQKQQLEKQLIAQQKSLQQMEQKNKIISHKIDVAEQKLAQLQNNQQSENEADIDCPCCNGHPEDCNKPECQLMGYCVTCSL